MRGKAYDDRYDDGGVSASVLDRQSEMPLGLTMAGPPGPGRREMRRTRQKKRRRGSVSVIVALLVLGLVAGGGFYVVERGAAWFDARFGHGADYAGPGTGEVVAEVKQGDTTRQIGVRLHDRGVVRSARAFVTAAGDNPRGDKIQPGTYKLRRHMKASLAVAMMLDPASRVGALSLPEGARASDVLARVAARSGIPLASLQQALKRPAALGLPKYAGGHVEGFLFPATYDVGTAKGGRKPSAEQVLAAMVKRYEAETADLDLEARARKLGITPYQAVIVASLVQAEARHEADFGKVARVVYNRLGSRFPYERKLQFDSTINYARNTRTLTLTNKEILSFNSPYNSYTHEGLPPTPIGNPGKAALEAALNPTAGNWRYFVTVNPTTGETRFTADYKQFQAWKQEFKRNIGH